MTDSNSKVNIIIAPLLICGAILALWDNEGRFDYADVAKKTQEVVTIVEANSEKTISYTGEPDKQYAIKDAYVQDIIGYYKIERDAEIYSWEENRSRKRGTTWSLDWQYDLEGNSRNQGIAKQLTSDTLYTEKFIINELAINPDNIHFVDSNVTIHPDKLKLKDSLNLKLEIIGDYLYKRQRPNEDTLGDERVRYSGIPIHDIATYFGLIQNSIGVAKQFPFNKGIISQFIKNDGILHHLVNGNREQALKTMQEHISRLKWLIRFGGTAVIVVAFKIMFDKLLFLLMYIPVLGSLIGLASWIVSIILGVTIALITIISSLIYYNPVISLISFAIVALAIVFYCRKVGRTKKNVAKTLDENSVDAESEVETTFISLVQLAMADNKLDKAEKKYLIKFGNKHNLGKEKMKDLFKKAKTKELADINLNKSHLINLICLAMADGTLCYEELKHIYACGDKLNMNKNEINELICVI